MPHFISTTIPYVNGAAHIGHAQEFVLADVLARYHDDVYFQSGTDENSLKNVLAAVAAGESVAAYVDKLSAGFETLTAALGLQLSDFVRTSTDARHQPVVEAIWQACEARGDIYQADYQGLYCVGCEQFFTQAELVDGVCPEHRVAPDTVVETNYFFRLTRYRDQLIELVGNDTVKIEPSAKKNEVLGYLRTVDQDLSISRSAVRARGWGIAVPGDPTQVIYVWIDALANYMSGPGVSAWQSFDSITHVVGKGVLRFHAVYWLAILLSAGLRLPTQIFVHNYVTVNGLKIGKSLGNAISPQAPIAALGLDAFRYYLLRHIGSYKDGDFTWDKFYAVYEHDLVNQLGNLIARVTKLSRQETELPPPDLSLPVDLAPRIAQHLQQFAVQRAMDEIWRVVERTNAYISEREPWRLTGGPRAQVLANALESLEVVAQVLAPFLPQTSARMHQILAGQATEQLFPRSPKPRGGLP